MPYDEMVNDRASWACNALVTLLSLPPVPGNGDKPDRDVHDAFTLLSTCPAEVRRYWMNEYGVLESEYLTWKLVDDIASGVRP